MKRIFSTTLLILLTSGAFCQFLDTGWTIGIQSGSNTINPSFRETNYKDKFNFTHMDVRYLNASKNSFKMVDASSIPDLLIVLGMALAKKEGDFELTGKLKKIQDYAGSSYSGYGSDFSFIQTTWTWGVNGTYAGVDFDLGSIGVTKVKNSGGGDVLVDKDPNGDAFIGVGGAAGIANERLRALLRVDRLWLGRYQSQKGIAIIIDGDFALTNFLYLGAYYKYRRFNEGDEGITKFSQNTFGLKTGFWISR
jgi:hypothetical protein